MRAIFLGVAFSMAAACKGEPKKSDELPLPPDLPMLPTAPDAGAPRKRTANTDGWLVLDPGASRPILVSLAVARMHPIKDSRVDGVAKIGLLEDGVWIDVALKGLAYLSKYTLRVHLLGDCSAEDGSSAGPGFAFDGSSLESPDPNAGVLGTLEADISGEAKGQTELVGVSLQGPYSIVGRALAIHSQQPTGTSNNTMLACGVIGVSAERTAPQAPPPPAEGQKQ